MQVMQPDFCGYIHVPVSEFPVTCLSVLSLVRVTLEIHNKNEVYLATRQLLCCAMVLVPEPKEGKCWSCYSPRQKRGPMSSKNVSTSSKICHDSRTPPKYESYSPLYTARLVPPPPGQQRRPHVVKLSPQPHVPLAWGFSKMNSALQQRRAESGGSLQTKIACQLECLMQACMHTRTSLRPALPRQH